MKPRSTSVSTQTIRCAVHFWTHKNIHEGWYRANAIFTAMALADPERAIAWLHEFYPRIAGENLRYIPQPWMTLATAIAADERGLWTQITRDVFHRWAVDGGDEQ